VSELLYSVYGTPLVSVATAPSWNETVDAIDDEELACKIVVLWPAVSVELVVCTPEVSELVRLRVRVRVEELELVVCASEDDVVVDSPWLVSVLVEVPEGIVLSPMSELVVVVNEAVRVRVRVDELKLVLDVPWSVWVPLVDEAEVPPISVLVGVSELCVLPVLVLVPLPVLVRVRVDEEEDDDVDDNEELEPLVG